MRPGSILDRAWPWLVTPALLVSECGCRFTPAEAECLADVEDSENKELAACKKNTTGECSTDEIMDRHDEAAERCVQ